MSWLTLQSNCAALLKLLVQAGYTDVGEAEPLCTVDTTGCVPALGNGHNAEQVSCFYSADLHPVCFSHYRGNCIWTHWWPSYRTDFQLAIQAYEVAWFFWSNAESWNSSQQVTGHVRLHCIAPQWLWWLRNGEVNDALCKCIWINYCVGLFTYFREDLCCNMLYSDLRKTWPLTWKRSFNTEFQVRNLGKIHSAQILRHKQTWQYNTVQYSGAHSQQ